MPPKKVAPRRRRAADARRIPPASPTLAREAPPAASGAGDGAGAQGETAALADFLAAADSLTVAERQRIIDQAIVLIEQFYVHLPLKRAMHAIDPLQRLRLVRHRIEHMSERQFHDELLGTFTSLRDLHTNYVLPQAFGGKLAFLPFLVEEFREGGRRRYLVSKLLAGLEHPTFVPGAEVTHWNGVPIERAVDLNAQKEAGSNADARHARGLEALTLRALAYSVPPDEQWVVVGYVSGGEAHELRFDWRVFEPQPAPAGVDADSGTSRSARLLGVDAKQEALRRAKKTLFVPAAMDAERRMLAYRAGRAARGDLATESALPDVFSFRAVDTPDGRFGYVRIWTFAVDDADEFVAEFVRIAGLLPQNGLILDVRGNGGGLILAGERLLQTLTPRSIEPERFHFINTPLTLRLCRGVPELSDWVDSIDQAVETGAAYSAGFPIEDAAADNAIGQKYQGPVVLVTDALCYSTTDIFAAGFQDHAIGPILGTAGNTGAGGANVWTHALLRQLLGAGDSPIRPLPKGASMRVAIRRTTRVGARSGVPVEDLGVIPDQMHAMTRDDLLAGNVDLIRRAARLLAVLPVRALSARHAGQGGGALRVAVRAANVPRVDVLVDGRPRATVDLAGAETVVELPSPGAGAHTVELRGYDREKLVAVTRLGL